MMAMVMGTGTKGGDFLRECYQGRRKRLELGGKSRGEELGKTVRVCSLK